MVVDLFVEDRAHEAFLKPLLTRVADEERKKTRLRVRSATGGHAKAIAEFKLYQRIDAASGMVPADLVVVAIDSNCKKFAETREEVKDAASLDWEHRLVVACPDPHIERWYLADPESFKRVVGHLPNVPKEKCERDYYKNLLETEIRKAGHHAFLGGVDFAAELVGKMVFYRAGKNSTSLKSFLEDLRSQLRGHATQ